MHKNLLFFLLGIFVLCSTCSKVEDLNRVELADRDAEYAVPVFQSSTTIDEILEGIDDSTALEVNDDGLLTLRYRGRFASRTSQDIFDVLTEFDNIPLPITDTVSVFPFEVPNEMDIDFAILKRGTMRIVFQSLHDEPVRVEFRLPNVVDSNDEPYTYRATVQPYPGGATHFAPTADFTGYILRPENDSLFIEYDCFKLNSQEYDTLTNFFMVINNFEASYIEGYLGNDIYELDRDTIEIDFFDNWTRGDVFFDDPKLNITVKNSFGFPVRSKANIVEVFTVNGDKLPLRSSFIDNGINFGYPLLSEVGDAVFTNFSFDRTNSNIDSILGAGPTAIDYDFDAVPNPDSDTSIRGFMTDSSEFTVQVEAELPMIGKTFGFAVVDTLDISLGSYNDIEQAEFKVVTENRMPLDLLIQAYFVDDAGEVIDSIFQTPTNVVQAASVDGNGDVIEEKETVTFITVDANRYNRLQKASQVFVRTSFSSVNDGNTSVRIRAQQGVEIRMGMKIKI